WCGHDSSHVCSRTHVSTIEVVGAEVIGGGSRCLIEVPAGKETRFRGVAEPTHPSVEVHGDFGRTERPVVHAHLVYRTLEMRPVVTSIGPATDGGDEASALNRHSCIHF